MRVAHRGFLTGIYPYSVLTGRAELGLGVRRAASGSAPPSASGSAPGSAPDSRDARPRAYGNEGC